MLNLLTDPWIPVLTHTGQRLSISPAEIGRPDLKEIGWPRADLRLAQMEFLIGLLATACPPEETEEWVDFWRNPPAPQILRDRFAPYADAFAFDRPDGGFLQDQDPLVGEGLAVGGLLIDQPGANTEKNNTDLFVKRGKIPVLARSTAAIVLYALQAFAPSGGAGHRTGLRGGGPMTTLAIGGRGGSLWHRLWLNVVAPRGYWDADAPEEAPAAVFPWLAPTRTSEKDGRPTTPADVHPAQCFWGMPRRIRLVFAENTDHLPCAVTGAVEDMIVTGYRTRPYGVNYTAAGGWHPLTPHYCTKPGTEWLPVHPQPGGIAYRHWPGLVFSNQATRQPAAVVDSLRSRRREAGDLRLLIAGYDMDNMKARGFLEAEMPLILMEAGQGAAAYTALAQAMAEASATVSSLLAGAVRDAMGGDGGEAHNRLKEEFYQRTGAAFFDGLRQAADLLETVDQVPDQAPDSGPDQAQLLDPLRRQWVQALRGGAMALFDQQVPAADFLMDLARFEKMATARRGLGLALAGFGKDGGTLYRTLGLPAPSARAGRTASEG